MGRQRGKKRKFTRWELTTKFSALLSGAVEQLQTSTAADAVLIMGTVPSTAGLILTERGDFLLTEAGAFLET
jgi:hypothetical protein